MNRISLKQIAEQLHVSHMTLYRVINSDPRVKESTRIRITRILNSHGYYMAKNQKYQTAIFDCDPTSRYMQILLQKVESMLPHQKLRIVYVDHITNHSLFMKEVQDATIVVFAPMRNREIYEEVKKVNPDILALNIMGDLIGDIAIAGDDFQGGSIAARYFLNYGHNKHVAVVSDGEKIFLSGSFNNRKKGFLGEILANAPNCRVDQINMCSGSVRCRQDSICSLMEYFNNQTEFPSAFFCTGEFFAKIFYDTVQILHKKIPDDFSLLSYDTDERFDRVEFSLEDIAEWTRFFIMNRSLQTNTSPVHLLLNMKIVSSGTVKKLSGREKSKI